MRWRVAARHASRGATAENGESPEAEALERASPGLAALFEHLTADGRHAILDLGPALDRHLRLLGRYATQIRFAGLLGEPPTGDAWTAALGALAPNPSRPYDVVLVWDLLDRLEPPARPATIARLAELSAPGARLHLIVDASDAGATRALRFTIIEPGRISQQALGPARPPKPRLLPAQVERLLEPFRVARAFTLRTGAREYVAVKRE